MDVETGRAGALPLCEFVHQARARILARWAEAVRGLPAAEPLSQPRLLDHMPDLLERIAEATGEACGGPPASLGEVPEIHAVDRLGEGFDLSSVVTEYRLLRGCVLDLYEAEQAASLPIEQLRRFDQALDEAILASVARYQRARERTLIALDRVSGAALEGGDDAGFLDRLLEVVLETTEAVDSVTVLLREGDRLVVRASRGLPERRESVSLRIGEGFAGRVAAERRPVYLRAAAHDPLLSPGLPAQGVLALYGVPLLSGDELVGVAHIGSRTAYEFSNEDKLLFRVMVGRAAALLARAQLRERERRARREADAALAQLEGFFAAAPLGAAFLDAELRYVRVNQALAAINGVSPAAHVGRHPRELLPADAAAQVVPVMERVLRTGEPVLDLEVERPVPGGELRSMLVSYFPVRGPAGEVLGVGASLLDVTERKRAAEALEEQRRLYESLLQAQSDLGEGFALFEGGRPTVVNDALCRMTGYSREELSRLSTLAELTPPADRDAYRERLERLEQAPQHYEMTVLRKDGEPIELEVSTIPLGKGRRLKVTRDVTFRKRAARERERLLAQLDETRRRLAAVLEAMPLGVVVAEAGSGRVLLTNRQAEVILGHPPVGEFTRLRGLRPDGTPYGPADWPLARALRTGEVIRGEEIDYRRPDGQVVTIAVSAAPIPDEAGRPQAAVAAFEDVTERKRTRQELAEAVGYRDRMVSVLGHDLRNPLAAIRTATALLFRGGRLAEADYKSVSRIDHAAVRMGELIRTLLDFSHSRFRGGLPVELQPVDLREVVESAVHELEAANPGRPIAVRARGDTTGVWDPHRLAQLVSNLVANALLYGDPSREITVTLEGGPAELRLQVHNWGLAIPTELLPRLFEPFQRGAGSSPGREGLGLGLFIVSQVVKAHGGTLAVESSAGAGTTFTVRLPREAGRGSA